MAVEFEENNLPKRNRFEAASGPKGMTGWFISRGWAKDEAGANKILVTIALICFALAIYFAFF